VGETPAAEASTGEYADEAALKARPYSSWATIESSVGPRFISASRVLLLFALPSRPPLSATLQALILS
jgi:hypothetical protein